MPQISLYMDGEAMRKIEKAARSEKVSVSAWVRKRLDQVIADQWPADYFDSFGTTPDPSFRRPDPPGEDLERAAL